MKFGDVLRALIEERGITQKALAKQLNLAPSTIGSYVQNTREPDFETLKRLAQYFSVSLDYLLDHNVTEQFSRREQELLRIFRNLEPYQQDICVEQCRVFWLANLREIEGKKLSS